MRLIARKDEADLISLAYACNEHVLMLGEPGTAKSLLADLLAKQTNGTYFRWTLMKMTTDAEIIGAVDPVHLLKTGETIRNAKHRLPACNIAFLDEIFKSNSAVLNALLTIMEERLFFNPTPTAVPLQMIVSASNELPAGKDAETLQALYDRFLFRTVVEALHESKWSEYGRYCRAKYVKARAAEMNTVGEEVQIKMPTYPLDEVDFEQDTIDANCELRGMFAREHKLRITDRRFDRTFKVLQGAASLAGRNKVKREDFSALRFVYWSTFDNYKLVRDLIAVFANPRQNEVNKLIDSAIKLVDDAANKEFASDDAKVSHLVTVNKQLKDVMLRLSQLGATDDENRKVGVHFEAFKKIISERFGV